MYLKQGKQLFDIRHEKEKELGILVIYFNLFLFVYDFFPISNYCCTNAATSC